MYICFYFIFLLINILNKSFIYALKFQTHKIQSTFNQKSKESFNLRNLNNENTNNKIDLNFTKENLYFFDIKIGNPSQTFSVLLDTGSNYFWINSDNCLGCGSKNKFITDNSKTYNFTNELININYISGTLKGKISSDIVKLNNNINISNFNFVLINESNINFELDGIFGLSKNIKDINNYKLSPISQLFENNIFNKNIFILDFPNNNFFIGEKPPYLNSYHNISCERKSIYGLNNYYWKCISKNIKSHNICYNSKENNIVFNSGINSVVFSLNYIEFFKNIISYNKLLGDAKCEISKTQENDLIYTLLCENFDKLINKENDEYIKLYEEDFISIYLDDNKNSISFKLEDLNDKINKNFKLYFIEIPDNTIIAGVPLFEKYTIMFNKDEEQIIFFNDKNKITYSGIDNINIYSKIAIIIVVVSIILILIYYILILRKTKYNNIKLERDFSQFGLLTQEGTYILK